MPRKTIKELEAMIDSLNKTVQNLRHELDHKRLENSYMRVTEKRFDQLLEGMCMGMREGALPRRTHA